MRGYTRPRNLAPILLLQRDPGCLILELTTGGGGGGGVRVVI